MTWTDMLTPDGEPAPPTAETAVIDAGSAAWRHARTLGIRLEVMDDLADAIEDCHASRVLQWTAELIRQAPAVTRGLAA